MTLAYGGATLSNIFDWDYDLWEVRLMLVAAGFFFYLCVFILSHWMALRISASYRSLPAKEKVLSNIAITRALLGIQSCVAGFWALLIDPVFQSDKVYSQQKWSWFHCLIASGFMLLENIIVHISNIVFRTCDVFLVVHHLFAFAGLLGVIINTQSGHYLPTMGLLLEISTPYICMYWLLRTTGYATTFLWRANQWVLVHMQHCRMVLIYHMWWVCISNWNDVVENLGLLHCIVFFTGLSVLTIILNPYWIYRSTRRLFGPVDWNFSFTDVFGSSGKLNSETSQKKKI